MTCIVKPVNKKWTVLVQGIPTEEQAEIVSELCDELLAILGGRSEDLEAHSLARRVVHRRAERNGISLPAVGATA